MKKILHIISGLDSGGAEKILIDLVSEENSNKHYIVSLKDKGIYKKKISSKNINVKCFNMNKFNFLIKIMMIMIYIGRIKPNIVLTWMYHADLIGGVIAKFFSVDKIYWNIRNSTLDKKNTNWITLIILKICSKLSNFIPDRIISCSEEAINVHLKLNYKNNFYLINNGVDTEKFKNLEFKINNNFLTLGYAGRWHHQKNYEFFFECLSELKENYKFKKFKVLMAGNQINDKNINLINLIKKNNLSEEIQLLDEIEDMPKFYNRVDLNILTSSHGEAFPNVLAESMSCETPCLSTDIGDAKKIIGNCGWIVSQNNKEMFCNFILEIYNYKFNLSQKWNHIKLNCRSRVIQNFSQVEMIKKYNNLFRN